MTTIARLTIVLDPVSGMPIVEGSDLSLGGWLARLEQEGREAALRFGGGDCLRHVRKVAAAARFTPTRLSFDLAFGRTVDD